MLFTYFEKRHRFQSKLRFAKLELCTVARFIDLEEEQRIMNFSLSSDLRIYSWNLNLFCQIIIYSEGINQIYLLFEPCCMLGFISQIIYQEVLSHYVQCAFPDNFFK